MRPHAFGCGEGGVGGGGVGGGGNGEGDGDGGDVWKSPGQRHPEQSQFRLMRKEQL